jgi:peptidoglycan/xylan/chitin deacetylase (PgdA/CDA1 family)
MSSETVGTLVVSLDTEFVWGMFDEGSINPQQYTGTREVIQKLLCLFDEYQVPATWALVTHLLTDCSSTDHDVQTSHPSSEEFERDATLPCERKLDRNLWYEPNLVELIEDANADHDIGSHTHTHIVFNEATRDAVRSDIAQSVTVAKRNGVDPKSFIFPRNQIAHLDVIKEAGFEVYRGIDERWYERHRLPASVVKGARFADEATKLTPPTVLPRSESGLVEIPGSQVFRPVHGGWQYTPTDSQSSRAIAGVNHAADSGRIFHVWFHPFNFARNPKRLLDAFEAVLAHARSLVRQGLLETLTMSEVAKLYRDGRWRN